MLVSLSDYQSLPTKPGIYLFLDERSNILYVGKAKNLKKRVNSYFAKYVVLGPKTQTLVSKINKIKTLVVNSEIEAFLLEANYIKKYKPKYNVKLTDDKAYPLIRITIKESYPKILIARKANDRNSIYFGPFPNGSNALRTTLRSIRRIFPYQGESNHAKKTCLYYYLHLCPCPPVFDSTMFKKEYKKTVKHIINFLNGSTSKVIRDLKKERDILSINENFEKASEIQKKIKAIELITGPFYKSELYSNVDPNLKEDQLCSQLSSLRYLFSQNGIYVKKLERIECYDISNTSGTNTTGSMVVFTNGEKDSNWYRRFKIRKNDGQNDFAMIEEILQRRIRHSEWPYPDLIIVDGGKGQVSSGLKVLKQMGKNIPLIGLAKREETIITSSFKQISLSKNSNALKLIMRIRDEAHRFAIIYHRKLRSKRMIY